VADRHELARRLTRRAPARLPVIMLWVLIMGNQAGLSRTRLPMIRLRVVITGDQAGCECLAAPARPGNPAVACTAATVPRMAAAQAGRGFGGWRRRFLRAGRAAGGLAVPGLQRRRAVMVTARAWLTSTTA